jgi:hypothetical protein
VRPKWIHQLNSLNKVQLLYRPDHLTDPFLEILLPALGQLDFNIILEGNGGLVISFVMNEVVEID